MISSRFYNAMTTKSLGALLSLVAAAHALRCPSPSMLAKPFKGGRLDDFISAGEAEAKYGAQRYAQISQDAWKLELDNKAVEAQRAASLQEFAAQKVQMLSDHAYLSLFCTAIFWSATDLKKTLSYGVGALLGGLYIYLQQRAVDSVGASTIEEVNRLPPPIVAPVLLVGLVAKNNAALMLLPALFGFATHQLAFLAQIAYPDGWWTPKEGATE